MAAQMITWVCGLAVFIFVPRFLGSDAYGRVYLAISFQMILGSIIDFGGNSLITKHISRDRTRASETMSEAISLRLILWVASLFIAAATGISAHYPLTELLLIMILAVSNLWVELTLLMRYCYLGFEDVKYPSIGAVAERGFLALSVIPALFMGAKELTVILLIAASGLVSFMVSARHAREMFHLTFSAHLKTVVKSLKEGLPYFLWAIFGIIYFRIDAVLLSLMVPDAVVGWYGAAYRFFDIVMFIPSILGQALYPIISKLSQTAGGAMISATQRSLKFLLLASIPIAVGFIYFSKPVVALLLGLNQFGPSVVILQLFSVGTVLVYMDFALGNAVQAIDRQKQWAFVGFFAMALNIVLNLLLIRYFQTRFNNGGIGAAVATDITELAVLLSAVYLLPRELFSAAFLRVAAKALVSGGLMALAITFGYRLGIPWPATSGIGLLTYAVSLFLLRTFDDRELELMGKAATLTKLRLVPFKRTGISQ